MEEPTRDELHEVIAIQAVEILGLKDRVETLRSLHKYDEAKIAELEKGLKLYQDESAKLWEKLAELEEEHSVVKEVQNG